MSFKDSNPNYGSTMSTDEPSTFVRCLKGNNIFVIFVIIIIIIYQKGSYTFVIIGLSVFLAFSGATGIGSLDKDADSNEQAQVIFMGIYIILFAGIF
jgi:hypothetical protein